MDTEIRRKVVAATRTVVIKIGTNVLSRPDDTLDVDRIASIAEQIHRVRETGRQVVLVSSGAIGAGMGLLGLKTRPADLPHLQAAAAAGQAHLIRLYDDSLRKHGYHAAQLLLTGNDFKNRNRYINVRNTLHTLFEYRAIPIVNENDTVSVAEIKFGDNDQLAAMVTGLLNQPLLIILSVVDGLFDGDPKSAASKRIPTIDEWQDSLLGLASPERSTRGTGGMSSKLEAVRSAAGVGANVIIANGTRPRVIDDILAGEDLGTLFVAKNRDVAAWKRWIGFTIRPKGRFVLDDGACGAIAQRGRSLLAIGITAVEGEFAKGEVVSLVDRHGEEFGRGLSNYNASDARSIAGKRTEEIIQLLGSLPYAEVINRDNLVVTR